MSVTITIEGAKIRARKIPKKRLLSIWKALTKKPLPRLMAFQLEDSEFDFALELIKDSDWAKEDEKREIEEWGSTLTSRGTDACIFDTEENSDIDYIIIVRQKPYHNLTEILKHELSHIAKGDL